jgi:hypothetical protein
MFGWFRAPHSRCSSDSDNNVNSLPRTYGRGGGGGVSSLLLAEVVVVVVVSETSATIDLIVVTSYSRVATTEDVNGGVQLRTLPLPHYD